MKKNSIGTDVNQVRIQSLSNIHGQPQVIENLNINLLAYFNTRSSCAGPNLCFGPVILCGPSGTGKTLVARALHAELGNLKLIETNGVTINNKADLFGILLNADQNTTVFIDEAQGMNGKTQQVLLTALSEKKVYVPSNMVAMGSHSLSLANFVIILATTHEYCLQDALRNRMRIYCRFTYYSHNDLVGIVQQRAQALGWEYESEEILQIVAQRAKKTPRQALNMNLQMCWNVARGHDRNIITLNDVREAFHHLQIDNLGLDSLDRSYLKVLHDNGNLALNVLSSKLGLPAPTLQRVVEPYLLKEGFILKDKASLRLLTNKGQKHLEDCLVDQQSHVLD